jgi:sugar lactone lactonase YvrE
MGNDVGIAGDGEIVVTSFVPLRQGLELRFVLAKAALGFDTGELLTWRCGRGWRALPGTRGAGPNGMLLSPDGRFVYYAENGRDRIVRLPREGASPERPPAYAEVGGNPDNLSWTDDGRILAVIHTGGIQAAFEPCLMKWALWEVDPGTLAARELLRHDGATLCGATSAAFVGGGYLIGSMSETRVGIWRPAAPPAGPSIR